MASQFTGTATHHIGDDVKMLVRMSVSQRYGYACHGSGRSMRPDLSMVQHLLLPLWSGNSSTEKDNTVPEYLPPVLRRLMKSFFPIPRVDAVPFRDPAIGCQARRPELDENENAVGCTCRIEAAEVMVDACNVVMNDKKLYEDRIVFTTEVPLDFFFGIDGDKTGFVKVEKRELHREECEYDYTVNLKTILEYLVRFINEPLKIAKCSDGTHVPMVHNKNEIVSDLCRALAFLQHVYASIALDYHPGAVQRIEGVIFRYDLKEQARPGSTHEFIWGNTPAGEVSIDDLKGNVSISFGVGRDVTVLHQMCAVVLAILTGERVERVPNLCARVDAEDEKDMISTRLCWWHYGSRIVGMFPW